MAMVCARGSPTLRNFPPIGHRTWGGARVPVHSKGIKQVKLRFDCLNVFDEVYEIRNGTGIGIAAPAYGQRRAFYGGLAVDF